MPNDSPLWGILRLAVIGTIFVVGANTLYANGWDKNDWLQLIALLGGSSTISYIQGKAKTE